MKERILPMLPPFKLIWKDFNHQKCPGHICFLPNITKNKKSVTKWTSTWLRIGFPTLALNHLKIQLQQRTTAHEWLWNSFLSSMQSIVCLMDRYLGIMVYLTATIFLTHNCWHAGAGSSPSLFEKSPWSSTRLWDESCWARDKTILRLSRGP